MDVSSPSDVFVFGQFRLNRRGGGLFRCTEGGDPTPVKLGSRALDVLGVLVDGHGDLVSKDEIMAAVWPGTAVEEANLSVQISALRRVLDRDRADGSCIQTVAGRGYRFAVPVLHREDAPWPLPAPSTDSNGRGDALSAEAGASHAVATLDAAVTADAGLGPDRFVRHRRRVRLAGLLTTLCLAIGALLLFGLGHLSWFARPTDPPRLSVAVLPFENLSGDPRNDYLIEGITDDLTTELAYNPYVLVTARQSASTYKGKSEDVRKIGDALGVRYVVEGSVRRIESTLRVDVRLTSAETGVQLWSDQFDEQITDLAAGQEQIVAGMRDELGINLVDIESARSLRERPANPDAFDLILRARSLGHLSQSLQRDKEAMALYERAVSLDPSSVLALVGVAYFLIDTTSSSGWGSFENMQRAEQLLARAREIAPDSPVVLETTLYWLRSVGRCQDVIEAAQHAIQMNPRKMRMWTGVYNELGVCETVTGHAEEEIALQEKMNQLNPRSPYKFSRYRHMGYVSLMLGRDQDAITFLQRSLAMKPEVDVGTQVTFRRLAAAYARTGQMDQARHFLSEADRLWPYDSIRSHSPPDPSNTVQAAQIRAFQAALHLAGERDHADEDADFGVPADGALHSEFAGQTPTNAPGVRTIRTAELARFIAEDRPVVVDTVTYSWGRSIPGAVGLKFAGLGGSFTDTAQDHLRNKMRELTAGDLSRPIVAVGWNSERFDGRNLALRLAALGYTQVYWDRGGREAWEVVNLPETDLALQEW